jgi:DNA-binding NtrC family response regulator
MEPGAGKIPMSAVRRRRILLVEDDFLTRWNTAEYLRETGFDVIEAVNARDAMAILGTGSPLDAVFSDVGIAPEMDGLSFSHWSAQHYPKLPILLTSGDPRVAGLVAPAWRFISKPYALNEVERHLHDLIEADDSAKPGR